MTNLSTVTSSDAAGLLYRDTGAARRPSVQGTGESSAKGSSLNDSLDYLEAAQQAAKRAARLNAAKATNEERDQLLEERQKLLDKYFAGAITRDESVRLDYVRWSLDRIEDARDGAALDTLENHIAQFEKVAEQLDQVQKRFSNAANQPRSPRPRR